MTNDVCCSSACGCQARRAVLRTAVVIAAAEEAANASTYRAAQSAAQAGAGVGQTECDTTCVASQAAAAAAEAGAAASAKVTSSACAEIEIRGVAALESWTNVTGRYLLQDFIRNPYARVFNFYMSPVAFLRGLANNLTASLTKFDSIADKISNNRGF